MHVLGKKPATADKPKKPSAAKIAKPAAQSFTRLPPQGAVEQQEAADDLDRFEARCNAEDPMRALMLMFWKNRNQNQAFSIDVTAVDLKGFEDCINYLEVNPQIRVFRPQGMPASAGAPETKKRSAIPPRPAGKPKDYVVIQMVDQNGDAFIPIENNEEDLKRSTEAKRIQLIRDTAHQLADQLIADLKANQTSSSTVMEAAEALKVLAAQP